MLLDAVYQWKDHTLFVWNANDFCRQFKETMTALDFVQEWECMMSDHMLDDCALHPNRALPMVQFRDFGARPEESSPHEQRRRGACFAFNDGSQGNTE